ncbi:MAG: hypothetical protein Q4C71_05200 [Microbacteriaceae bacterium]|nr:hypothetical protein [Microbacteriaceae bacterium]
MPVAARLGARFLGRLVLSDHARKFTAFQLLHFFAGFPNRFWRVFHQMFARFYCDFMRFSRFCALLALLGLAEFACGPFCWLFYNFVPRRVPLFLFRESATFRPGPAPWRGIYFRPARLNAGFIG